MNKKCMLVIVLLVLVIGIGFYKFAIQGSVAPAVDGRVAILLSSSERDMVLAEMRAFLASSQQIVQAVAEEDLSSAVAAAKKSGLAAQGAVPASLIGKLPLEFKKLGLDTHSRFDQLAMDSEDLGDGSQTLAALARLMQNCVTCHAGYRIDAVE